MATKPNPPVDWIESIRGIDANLADQLAGAHWLDDMECVTTQECVWRDHATGWHYEATEPRDHRDEPVQARLHYVITGTAVDSDVPDTFRLLDTRYEYGKRWQRVRIEHATHYQPVTSR